MISIQKEKKYQNCEKWDNNLNADLLQLQIYCRFTAVKLYFTSSIQKLLPEKYQAENEF
jgi:hypothetical protein